MNRSILVGDDKGLVIIAEKIAGKEIVKVIVVPDSAMTGDFLCT